MSEDSRQYEEAEEAIPTAWYENLVIVLVCSAAVSFAVNTGMLLHPERLGGIELSAISAMLYIYGRVLDVHSTSKALRLMKCADRTGIRHPIEESNPYLPDRPSLDEYFRSPKKILDYTMAGIAVISPTAGITIGFVSGVAALNNYRKAQRLERAIELSSGR